MATQEKLLKSLESLRSLLNSNLTSDISTRKKEKLQHCNVITEAMANSTIRIAPNFGYLLSLSIEVLLQLCDDPESDVRMVVDECLNRLIRAMSNGNMSKIQIELHKEIKKNGSPRSLRAALWRFSELAHHIRPHKGKPYVANLMPCIVKIAERTEESVHDTLASSLPKIMAALGCFTMDNDTKALLKAFLNNISSNSAVIRRTTATCILTVCLNCRKPYVFVTYILNSLLDMLIPIQDTHTSALILGVLNCLKVILPHIKNSDNDQEIKGSFGVRKEVNETPLAVDRLLQVYELCLHYILDMDHNIINASLETLNMLLQNAPPDLISVLLSSNGISKSRISFYDSGNKLRIRSPSQLSVATTSLSGEDSLETDLMDSLRPDIEKWIDESKLSVLNITYARTAETIEKPSTVDNCDQSTNNVENTQTLEYSNIAIGSITGDGTDSVKCDKSVTDNLDKLVLSETSSEKSFTQHTDDKSLATTNTNVMYQEIDIGDFKDKDVPLFYCTRLIIKSFLLSGYPNTIIPDKSVRVSVKSLSLTCLATILQICPHVFLKYIDKYHSNNSKDIQDKQQISDILLFKDHVDPQLRGTVRIVIGNFLKAVLTKSGGDYDTWIIQNSVVNNEEVFHIKHLINIMVTGLKDESSNCTKQTMQGLNICLKHLLESQNSLLAVPVLDVLPVVAKNPYWLVKATLVDVVAELHYVTIHHICGTSEFQDKVIFNILFELLKDENQKVRAACSSAIVQVIPFLYFKQQIPNESTATNKAKYYKNLFLTNLCNIDLDINLNKKHFIENMPFPFNAFDKSTSDTANQSFSRVISKLCNFLLTSTSKYFIYGCIETLCLLSASYPPTIYSDAWSCFTNFNATKEQSTNIPPKDVTVTSSTGLFNVCINLLCNGNIGYDLNCHLNLLKLGGNLFAGISTQNLKLKTDLTLEDTNQLWAMFTDKSLSTLTEQFFIHILKLLNIFTHVIDEIVPTQPQNKPVLPNLPTPSSLSPIKRRKSDLGERTKTISPGKVPEKDDKSEKKSESTKTNLMGYFINAPHYLKIYELLRTSYTNYKTTLDSEASEKFLDLLKTTLQTLSQLLELATLLESGRISEEILNYCRCTFNLEPSSTVECVQQLLKSLFGTNLTCNASDILDNSDNKQSQVKDNEGLFYHSIFQKSYSDMSACVTSFHNSHKVDRDGDNTVMGYLHRKEHKKSSILPRGADKILANYIRLFEPMVIKSLKQYTITSDVKLQCKVLQLLCQLVQLRVNYCLLDSEQIFIGFVLKQFEFIEEGQIPFSNELIPRIFNFLVHLSYGKQHSKSIIGVPKIIQLCDGLMASGQPPLTHCIPALEPVVEDIFLFRNRSNTSDFKELETTREVLLSMLLRLLEYSDVIHLLTLILNESKYCTDNSDKWLRWSKQVTDIFLPMLKQNKISINNKAALTSLRKLVFILNPSVFKPLNDVLIILFDEPPYKDSSLLQINRWLGKVLTLLLIVSQVKEELLLLKIMEIQSDFVPRSIFRNISTTADPLNVTNTVEFFNGIIPEVIFIRYIFRVIDIAVDKCVNVINEQEFFLIEQISSFLMFCLHIFQSGSHCKIANVATEIINNEFQVDENEEPLPLDDINQNMLKLVPFFPTVTFEWCYLLALLNYSNRKFWSKIIQITESYGIVNHLQDSSIIPKFNCINLEIVRVGGTIIFCDYLNENMADGEQLSWFLVNNIELLVRLCDEEPVCEFLSSLHRNSSASGLVIQAITTKCLPIVEPTFRTKILKTVENAHPSQVGALLCLLLPKLLNCRQLALSRLVANLASRKIELLLTMSMEEVSNQLPKEDLMRIMDLLVETKLVKKHEALVSLLNKLATQYYDLSPLEFDQRRTVNPEYVKKLQINKVWYVSQVKSKSRSSGVGLEISELLSCLDYGDLINIMSNKDFNKLILKDCIAWSINQMKENNLTEEPCLLKAAINILIKNVTHIKSLLPKPHQVYKVIGRHELPLEIKYSNRLSELLSDELFWNYLYDIIPSVTCYIELIPFCPNLSVPDNTLEDFTKFAIICLESINYLIDTDKSNLNINYVDTAINCAKVIVTSSHLCSILTRDSHMSWLCSAINSIYKLIAHLLLGNEPLPDIPKYGLITALENLETVCVGHACHQLSVLVSWLEKIQNSIVNIPKFLLISIKSIIISLCRLPLVNSYLLTPPCAWKNGLTARLSGTFNTQLPPVPIEFLQEVDILEEFIYRITLLGWTSRQQFEETWMCLLGVLSSNPTEDSIPEEINAITHVTSLAVQAITSLLLQTLCIPTVGDKNVSKLLHVPRDLQIDNKSTCIKKLKNVHNKLQYKFNEHAKSLRSRSTIINVFNKPNLEKLSHSYSFGQLSVEYLLISAKIVEIVDETRIAAEVYAKRQKILDESGLDLNSCLQFLIDLYSQWIKMQNTPLRILYEVVKSVLVISDLFTEKSQFAWMLEVCLDLTKTHTIEDEILQQYLVIGACKAAAILTPDIETYENVKKLIVQNLKSGFLPSKIASLHGMLYILQGSVLGNTRIGGLSEEMQLIFPIAVDYIQCHLNLNNGVLSQSSEHNLLLWAMAFYLIENVEESNFSADFIPLVVQAAITQVSQQKISAVQNAILKGLERLVIKRSISGKMSDQLVKLSLEKMRNGPPSIALPAVQMLLTCLYIGLSEQLENSDQSSSVVQSNPDNLVQTIEKISAIFDRIKRGFPFEVEILCAVLPDILNDCFPSSDILTKVLGEFLSPQQPHPKLLSRVVFKVFECAIEQSQLSLLQDWVVFSLSNFTQSFSIGMATWCLTCFFISASTNEWLRSVFPYVQSRVGRYEYEDRKMLCIAGADFYKHLTTDKQREIFVSTFTKVKDQADMPFHDLLASL